MKYVLLSALLIFTGCASTTDNIRPLESTSVDFDVLAGRYDQLKLTNWKVGSSECVEFTLKKPYNTTNFLASVMFHVKGNSKDDMLKIMLYTEHKDSNSLTLASISSDKQHRLFQKNINFGEAVKFNVIFTNNHTIGLKLLYSEFSIPLQFKINSVLIGASSSQATVKILDKSDCGSQR